MQITAKIIGWDSVKRERFLKYVKLANERQIVLYRTRTVPPHPALWWKVYYQSSCLHSFTIPLRRYQQLVALRKTKIWKISHVHPVSWWDYSRAYTLSSLNISLCSKFPRLLMACRLNKVSCSHSSSKKSDFRDLQSICSLGSYLPSNHWRNTKYYQV